MPEQNGAPTETSPLLPKPADDPTSLPGLIDSGAGLAPDGVVVNEGSSPANDNGDGGDVERVESRAGRTKQYQGMPEVMARLKYMFPALALGVFLSAADQTIIVSSYGKIGTDLDALNKTSWIATAYFLTLTCFQPLYGKLSDIFSRKSCLLFGYTIFGIGCLFCGLAQNINQLIAARAFAGIGGGGMTTVVSIILSDVVPLKQRGAWQGYINIVYASGAGFGAPLGGILADTVGWRVSFLFQVPICALAFISVALFLHLPKRDNDKNWKAKLRQIDFLGAALLVLAVFCLLFGLDRGSNLAWKDKVTLIPLCMALPLFALFVIVEVKIAAEPFAPGHIIFERSLFACYLCNGFSFAGWLAGQYYLSLYFQAFLGLSASHAGVLLIPCIFASVCGSLFGGFYMRYTGKYYWITVIAYSSLVVGLVLLLLFTGVWVESTVGVVLASCICGFSNGIGVTTNLIALISNVARDDQAVATACTYLFRSLGSTTGISLSAAAANQVLRARLMQELNPKDAEKISQAVRRSLEFVKTLNPSVREIVRHCYSESARAAFGLQIGLVAGAAIAAWFIREKPLSR